MATSEALIKYYDCLKDSFNRIQDKDNQTALINAALRPKIREEFEKSQEVLFSYLNYIQVFSLIYSDKFAIICNNIITPLFKENTISSLTNKNVDNGSSEEKAVKIHDAIQTIISSKPDLTDDFVHSVVKTFPNVYDERHVEDGVNKTFLTYLKNCIKTCTYLYDEHLVTVLTKVLDKLNPPPSSSNQQKEEFKLIKQTVEQSYDLIYECLNDLDENQLELITKSLLSAFTREFLSSQNQSQLNLLLLYLCSLKDEYPEILINYLWNTFTDSSRPLGERRSSVAFASSFLARANYIGLDKVLKYLDTANEWCQEFLTRDLSEESSYENVESFLGLAQSMFYLITQRYREMYEEETITKLNQLDLNRIIQSPLSPLQACDIKIGQRFKEVAALYHIANPTSIINEPMRKKRKSDHDKGQNQYQLVVPFPETSKNLPARVKSLYRDYYDHRNFTIYRE